ncbi:vomeronasal type-2 receptor 26-like [Pelobates cultripes]|uniref:Vomeronasal type-2 receptor 26-like n=1 Tax=Pelobates cultripes TaxID=61616 RepID=A0AAD1W866_PELCU|nr:vomeronasal type-2 receptor 26-like [Pelobates cultripes]
MAADPETSIGQQNNMTADPEVSFGRMTQTANRKSADRGPRPETGNEKVQRFPARPRWKTLHLNVFLFAIEHVNMNPNILANITLGYHFYDSCLDTRKAVKSVLQILSGPEKTVPNYSCVDNNKLTGFIGDHYSFTTMPIAQILGVYGYSQISYGATDYSLSERLVYPHFFRMVQNDYIYFKIVTQLLKHFGWTWVGIVTTNDDTGGIESQVLTKYMASNGICTAFMQFINPSDSKIEISSRINNCIITTKSKIIVLCGSLSATVVFVMQYLNTMLHQDYAFIFPPSWASNFLLIQCNFEILSGSLAVEPFHLFMPETGSFFDNIHPSKRTEDKLLENIWIIYYSCLSTNTSDAKLYGKLDPGPKCSCERQRQQSLTRALNLALEQGLQVMDILKAKALKDHTMHSRTVSHLLYSPIETFNLVHLSLTRNAPNTRIKWKLALVVYSVHLRISNMTLKSRSLLGEFVPSQTSMLHWTTSGVRRKIQLKNSGILSGNGGHPVIPHGEYHKTVIPAVHCGVVFVSREVITKFVYGHMVQNAVFKNNCLYISWTPSRPALSVRPGSVRTCIPHDDHIPKSVCSEKCLPGTRKVLRRGTQTCCYDCIPCSDGEITNRTGKSLILKDSENCDKCLSNEWPNERKDRCIPKLEEFLSYRNDTIAIILSSLSIFCFLITVMILVIFIWFQDTPIVKANNKNLSFVLLVSIMLSFLCVFLFLGHPVDITCMLRQTAFGILFSIAISCILGKTIIIYFVFKATQPGSVWKSFVSLKVSNCFVFCCSAVQIIINVIWLASSPPFMELDTHSHQGTVIIQCNEGSVIAFYSVLGYMGVLAAISFIIAFLARTLPDSFNEAKYITFSMLVFCSVWIAMIPAYLSTKGKYMVAVEIFAILTSSTGLLACLFFPKCFNVIFRSEINTKSHLYGASVHAKAQPYEDYEYFRDGDIIIGGVLTTKCHLVTNNDQSVMSWHVGSWPLQQQFVSMTNRDRKRKERPNTRHYINLLIFMHVNEHVNLDPSILPNITLGYHIYDSCTDPRKAVKSVLQILSGAGKTVPNYSCMDPNKLVGFIGDHYSITTIPIAQLLGLYGYAQLFVYHFVASLLGDTLNKSIRITRAGIIAGFPTRVTPRWAQGHKINKPMTTEFYTETPTYTPIWGNKILKNHPDRFRGSKVSWKSLFDRPHAWFHAQNSSRELGCTSQSIGLLADFSISYGVTEIALNERHLYPHLFHTHQNNRVYFKTVSKLLKAFGWSWVGIIASDNDSGDTDIQSLKQYITNHGFCVAFSLKINVNDKLINIKMKLKMVRKSSAHVILLCGPFNIAVVDILVATKLDNMFHDKTLIIPPSWASNYFITDFNNEPLNGSLAMDFYYLPLPNMSFIDNIHPSNHPEDILLEDIWLIECNCLSRKPNKNKMHKHQESVLTSMICCQLLKYAKWQLRIPYPYRSYDFHTMEACGEFINLNITFIEFISKVPINHYIKSTCLISSLSTNDHSDGAILISEYHLYHYIKDLKHFWELITNLLPWTKCRELVSSQLGSSIYEIIRFLQKRSQDLLSCHDQNTTTIKVVVF